MRVSIVTCTAALGLAITQSGQGQAATFDFSFSNAIGNVSGTVSGEIFGLADTGTSAATDIVLTSAPTGVGFSSFPLDIFTLPWTNFANSFTVTAGQITDATFASEAGNGSRVPHLLLNLGVLNVLNNIDGQTGVENEDGFAGITFTPVASPMIPEPSTWAMMLVGFAGLGLAGYWASRKSI
jgi:hypothetical protein